MDSPVFNSSIRNRSGRAENVWTTSVNVNVPSAHEYRRANEKNNQTVYVYAYLLLEKNMKTLTHTCKKMYALKYF